MLSMPPDGHATLVDPVTSRTAGLITRRGRPLSPAAQQLYDQMHAMAATSKRRSARATSNAKKNQPIALKGKGLVGAGPLRGSAAARELSSI